MLCVVLSKNPPRPTLSFVTGDSFKEVQKLHTLLTDLIFLAPMIFNLRRRKSSFTVKIKMFEDSCTKYERDMTYMWHATHGASQQDNDSLSSSCHDDDGEWLMQKFKG